MQHCKVLTFLSNFSVTFKSQAWIHLISVNLLHWSSFVRVVSVHIPAVPDSHRLSSEKSSFVHMKIRFFLFLIRQINANSKNNFFFFKVHQSAMHKKVWLWTSTFFFFFFLGWKNDIFVCNVHVVFVCIRSVTSQYQQISHFGLCTKTGLIVLDTTDALSPHCLEFLFPSAEYQDLKLQFYMILQPFTRLSSRRPWSRVEVTTSLMVIMHTCFSFTFITNDTDCAWHLVKYSMQ